MKKLIVWVASLAMVAGFALTASAAEWNFYGSARVGTWVTDVDSATGGVDDRDFDEALECTVRWYQDNTEWWKKIKEKSRDFKSFYSEYYSHRK